MGLPPRYGPASGVNGANAAAVSRLARMELGARYTRESAILGSEHVFTWHVLTGTERQEAVAAAMARMLELGLPIELRYFSDLEEECIWQILYRAMRDAAGNLLAASAAELRDTFTEDWRTALIGEYLDLEASVDPSPGSLTSEEIRAIEDAVKKKDLARLKNFGSSTLSLYLLTSADPPPN